MGFTTFKRAGSILTVMSSLVLSLSETAAQEAAKGGASEQVEDVDDLDLMKVLNVQVSTATKGAENLDDAPAVITVVTREDIERWGYRSVGEVLANTVGFFSIDDHILPNVGVRGVTGGLGAESSIIKVMIDGRSVAYRTTSGNWLGVELIPLTSVQQIEIIRGPASALYGADAFLGVVNIITVKPNDARTANVRVDGGFSGTNPAGTADATVSKQFGAFDVLLGAALEHGDRSGLTLPAESPAPTLPDYVGERRTALNLERRSGVIQSRFGLRGELGHLELSGYFSGIERGGDFAQWAQLTNDRGPAGEQYGTTVGLGQLRINLDGLLRAAADLDLALQATYFQGGILPSDRVEVGSELFYVERRHEYRGVDTTAEARWRPAEDFNAIVGVETLVDEESFTSPELINRSTGRAVDADQVEVKDVRLTNVGEIGRAHV